jgi:hypothetical protein
MGIAGEGIDAVLRVATEHEESRDLADRLLGLAA